jgi:hypothetical protein
VTNQINVPEVGHSITVDADTARVVARVGRAVIADTNTALDPA